jgi:hypothetical protein
MKNFQAWRLISVISNLGAIITTTESTLTQGTDTQKIQQTHALSALLSAKAHLMQAQAALESSEPKDKQ